MSQAKDFDKLFVLDKVIHERVRLGIMAILSSTPVASFQEIKRTLNVTDGNLSIHLKLLHSHGYISVQKDFKDGKPQSSYQLTKTGLVAFREYVNTMECFIRNVNLPDRK